MNICIPQPRVTELNGDFLEVKLQSSSEILSKIWFVITENYFYNTSGNDGKTTTL